MPAGDRVSIVIEPGLFDSVVLRQRGMTIAVPARRQQEPPEGPWIPPSLPPPARAVRIELVDAAIDEVMSGSAEPADVLDSGALDIPIAERSSPGMTIVIVVEGTNLVDLDDDDLRRQLQIATEAGADVVIRLEQ